jgi:hypothetical protein
MPAANSLPNPNPFGYIQKWLESAVILIAMSQRTMMIDRALAEDLADAFQTDISNIPDTIEEMIVFVREYIKSHLENGSIVGLTARLQYAVQRLNQIIVGMGGEI